MEETTKDGRNEGPGKKKKFPRFVTGGKYHATSKIAWDKRSSDVRCEGDLTEIVFRIPWEAVLREQSPLLRDLLFDAKNRWLQTVKETISTQEYGSKPVLEYIWQAVRPAFNQALLQLLRDARAQSKQKYWCDQVDKAAAKFQALAEIKPGPQLMHDRPLAIHERYVAIVREVKTIRKGDDRNALALLVPTDSRPLVAERLNPSLVEDDFEKIFFDRDYKTRELSLAILGAEFERSGERLDVTAIESMIARGSKVRRELNQIVESPTAEHRRRDADA